MTRKAQLIKPARVGILTARFAHAKDYAGQHGVKHLRNWLINDIVRDENEIDELLALGAPMEIYERVYRSGKD